MKILELYRSLSESDLIKLSQGLKSNSSKENLEKILHEHFSERSKESDEKQEDEWEIVREKIQKKLPVSSPLLRLRISRWQQRVEKVLRERLQSEEEAGKLLLLRHYRHKKSHKNFRHLSKQMLEELGKKRCLSESELMYKHRLLQEMIEYKAGDFIHEQKDIFRLSREAMQCMDEHIALYKIKNICSSLNFQRIAGEQFDIRWQDPILKDILEGSATYPLILIYRLVYLCLTQPQDETHYHSFKEKLYETVFLFESTDRKEVFSYIQNYCIQKINRGEARFQQELFELYQLALDQDILLEDGILNTRNFNNISRLALNLKAYEWVEQFIAQYQKRLPAQERENTTAYNLGMTRFSKGHYGDVQKVLRSVNLDDELYGIGYRTLLAKAYFEMDDLDLLHYLLESFDKFIRRKKGISEEHRRNALNFIRLLRSLSKLKPYDRRAVRQIKQRIEQQNSIEKKWLLEKLTELEPEKYYS